MTDAICSKHYPGFIQFVCIDIYEKPYAKRYTKILSVLIWFQTVVDFSIQNVLFQLISTCCLAAIFFPRFTHLDILCSHKSFDIYIAS